MKIVPLAALGLGLTTAPAFASPVDNLVANLIVEGQMGAAQDRIDQRLVRNPGNVAALLNRAFVEQASFRTIDAEATYRRVLDLPEVAVTTNEGQTRSSHDIARAAMGRGTVTVVASR